MFDVGEDSDYVAGDGGSVRDEVGGRQRALHFVYSAERDFGIRGVHDAVLHWQPADHLILF